MYKLVRDKIPELMKENNQICNYAAIQNEELYGAFLNEKLIEEVNEFLSSPSKEAAIEELCDITCVIDAICSAIGVSKDDFCKLCTEKEEKNGAFDKRYILLVPDVPLASARSDADVPDKEE